MGYKPRFFLNLSLLPSEQHFLQTDLITDSRIETDASVIVRESATESVYKISTNARNPKVYDFHPKPLILPLHTAETIET